MHLGKRSLLAFVSVAAIAAGASASAEDFYFRAKKSAPEASIGVQPEGLPLSGSGNPTMRGGQPGGELSLDVSNAHGGADVSVEGKLPNGVRLENGKLVGTPTEFGLFPITFVISDADPLGGRTIRRPMTLEVAEPVSVSGPSALSARIGAPMSGSFSVPNARGSVAWSASGSLPSGVSVSPTAGTVSGNAGSILSGYVDIVAKDSFDGAEGRKRIAVQVIPLPSVASGPTSVSGRAGVPLSASWGASNVLGTAAWSASGTLPPGTAMSGATLSGTPTASGSGSFSVSVRDPSDGLSGSRSVDWSILPAFRNCSAPWGGTVAHGSGVTAWAAASATSCSPQTRTCSDGTLSGSYANQSCTVVAPRSCTTPWGTTVAHGGSVTAWAASASPSCSSQTRKCNDGTLSGSNSYQSCSFKQTYWTYAGRGPDTKNFYWDNCNQGRIMNSQCAYPGRREMCFGTWRSCNTLGCSTSYYETYYLECK